MNKNINNKKNEALSLIKILSNNKTIYLIDISNLNNNQIFDLRKNFYNEKIQMKVIKNSILKKSIKDKLIFKPFIDYLKGNTSIIFSNEDKGRVISTIIKNFHQKEKGYRPILKIAYVQESFYLGNKNLEILVNLKSKEELIVDILYYLNFPIEKTILSLNQTINKIYSILKSLSTKKLSNY